MPADATLGRRNDLVPAVVLRLASDRRLVEQVRAGSERAFEALFDRHHRPVLAFCRHMLGSREEAEDVVQLTFLAAYRDLGRAEPPTTLRPWLYAIARHRCLSVLRARREHPVAEVAVPATDRLAADVATREDLRAILGDVAHLPDDQRAALVLAEFGDVSHEEIARILACPRDKVKALVFQARSSLLASRVARDTPCADIREQLATLRGGALRRTTLRRHLRECPACSAFREQVRVQRRALGLLLPVAPGVGLKRMVLGAILGPSAGGTAFTAAALSSGGVAAALVVLAIPGGGVTAAANALGGRDEGRDPTPTVQRAAPASAWPRQRADQHRVRQGVPGSGVPVASVEEHGARHLQTSGAQQAQPAGSSGQREPARPQQAAESAPPPAHVPAVPAAPLDGAKPSQPDAPATHGKPAKPATPAEPHKRARPPQPHGRPAPPAGPARPPQAHGQPTPAKPATPARPQQAKGRPTPTAPAGPNMPPQANGQANRATPSGGAPGPPSAAAPGAAHAPAVTPPAPAPPKGH